MVVNGDVPLQAAQQNGGGRGKAVAPMPAAALESQVTTKQKEVAELQKQIDDLTELVAEARADRKQLLTDKARLEDRERSLQAQVKAERDAAGVWEAGYRRAAWWATANGLAFGATAAALAVVYVRCTRTAS